MSVYSLGSVFLLIPFFLLSLPYCCPAAQNTDGIVDIYSSVSVTSSSVLQDGGVTFVPQWAIDRVENRLWANCFVSRKERNPWWRLDFGGPKTIHDVHIDTRKDDETHQPSVKLIDMAGLSVYANNVSNTTDIEDFQKGKCGASHNGTDDTRIKFLCQPPLTGRHVYVVLPSSEKSKHLALCEIFFNLEIGKKFEKKHLKPDVEIVTFPPTDKSKQLFSRAYGSNREKCASTEEAVQSHAYTMYFDSPVVFGNVSTFLKTSKNMLATTFGLFAGSQLVNDGTDLRQSVSIEHKGENTSLSLKGTISFVQYLVITGYSSKEFKSRVCQIEIFQNSSVLNIYSSSVANALNQLSSSNLPSKAIDKSFQTESHACYQSKPEANSWWRVKLPSRTGIYHVVVTTLKTQSAFEQMNGFRVYIGNRNNYSNPDKDNTECGSARKLPSSETESSTIFVHCGGKRTGKYVYIVASNSSQNSTPSLSLCEVQLFSCQGSIPMPSLAPGENITVTSSGDRKHLSCSASGCPPPVVQWTGPDGKEIPRLQTEISTTSTILASRGGKYNCKAHNGMPGKFEKNLIVSVYPKLVLFPKDVVVSDRNPTNLTCVANGYPSPTVEWMTPSGKDYKVEESTNALGELTSTIYIPNAKGADGGDFGCTASNGIGSNSFATATVFVKPKITKPTNKMILVSPGQTVTVECIAEGYPKPKVAWKLTGVNSGLETDDVVMTSGASFSSGSSFKLNNVTVDQKGQVFTCEATSSVGSVSLTVTLNFPTRFTVQPQDKRAKIGDNVTLSCEATGAAAKFINWYNGNKEIDSKYVFSAKKSNRSIESILTLSNVQLRNGSTKYFCKVSRFSNFSQFVVSKQATIAIKPNITKLTSTRRGVPDGTLASPVECVADGYPNPTVTWKLQGSQSTLTMNEVFETESPYSNGSSLSLGRVSIGQNGSVFTCEASNSAGLDSSSFTLRVKIDAHFTVQPQNAYAKVTENVTLSCEATGVSAKFINWYKDNKIISSKYVSSTNGTDRVTSSLTLPDVKLINGSTNYVCKVSPFHKFLHSVSSQKATVGILGSISEEFESQLFLPGIRIRSLVCAFSANPRPTGGEVKLNNETIASWNKTASSSAGFIWTVWTKPMKTIEAKDGGNYNCIGRMGPNVEISRTVELGVAVAIATQPQSLVLIAGKTQTLSCIAKGFPMPSITWVKKIGKYARSQLGREYRNFQNREINSNLTFTGNSLNGAGSYQCVATNMMSGGIRKEDNSSFVDVSGKAIIVTRSTIRIATRRNSEELECNATGYPLPKINWTLRGENLSGARLSSSGGVRVSSMLTKQNVTALKDGGEYICSAENSAGNASLITVTMKFVPQVIRSPLNRKFSYGKSVNLSCQISFFPAISSRIKWRKDGHLLPVHWSTDLLNDYNTSVTSTLYITSVNESTGGTYTCFNSSKPATIAVRNYFVVNPKDENSAEGNSATLSCKVVGYPVRDVVWEVSISPNRSSFSPILITENFHLERRNESRSRESALTMKKLLRNSTGFYLCSVREGKKTIQSRKAYVDVAYLDLVTLQFSGNGSVLLRETFRLSCTAVGNPSPTINFYVTSLALNPITKRITEDANHTVAKIFGKITLTVSNSQTSDSGKYFCKAINAAGQQDSDGANVTVSGPPSKIDLSNVTATNRTNSSITFRWPEPYDGSSPILSYTVKYKPASLPDNEYQEIERKNKTALNEKMVGLKPFTKYAILIVAWNIQGGAQGSKPVYFQTTAGISSPPRNFTVDATNSTAVSVLWEEPSDPNGLIRYYRVFYKKKEKQKREALINYKDYNGNTTLVNITGLQKFSEYELRVRAINVDEDNRKEILGNASETKTVTTDQDAPTEPLHVNVSSVDNSTILVTWEQPEELNGIIQNYRVFYKKKGSTNVTLTTNSTGNRITIGGLEVYTTYEIQVQAFTILPGPLSNVTKGKTEEGIPSSPLNLTIVKTGQRFVSLRWEQPAFPRGEINFFTVYYGSRRFYHKKSKTTLDRHITIKNLAPNTKWTFYVVASTVKGPGNRSKIAYATTSVAAANPVDLSEYTNSVSTTTASIYLPKPSEENGQISRIELLVVKLDSDNKLHGINFKTVKSQRYSQDIASGQVYVAATFYSRDQIVENFILGNGKTYGGYVNGPLEAGTSYGYTFRVYTASDDSLVSVSKPVKIVTKGSGNITTIVVGVVVGILLLAILVTIIVIIMVRRTEKPISASDVDDGDIELIPSEKPAIIATIDTVLCVVGETVTLNVQVTGQPRPSVEWRFKGQELPVDDPRIVLLESGSLQIRNVSKTDIGLYECTASSNLGSSYEQVILRLENLRANASSKKKEIARDDFEAYVKETHADGFFEEYGKLDGSEKHYFVVGRRAVNGDKNRYGNIIPYDKSRVVLETLPGVPGSDYINASFMDAYCCPRGYIAAQGTTEGTLNDFWRMVWQMEVPTIVMVTNLKEGGKKKCAQYWPDSGKRDFGQVSVSLHQEQYMSECVVRTLHMVKHSLDGTMMNRSATQFHFTDWPDHGVPASATSLLNFVKRARSYHDKVKETGPMLVHCSAGVGRTGTFLVTDFSLQKLKAENTIDIFNLVNDLRENRRHMVQTEGQYVFCHYAILEYVLCGDTDIPAHKLQSHVHQLTKVDPSDNKSGIEKELQLLKKICPEREAFSFRRGSDPTCSAKNRYPNRVPPDVSLVHLDLKPGQKKDYTYINAYSVDEGYRSRSMFIATQGPLDSTVDDFWRMIWEQQCSTIVMLTELQEGEEEMSARYWPLEDRATYCHFTVELDSETAFGDYVVRGFNVTDGTETPRLIKQYHYMTWTESELPKNTSSLLDMLAQVERAKSSNSNSKIVVVCNNGVERSSTFCAISIILERLKLEQVVDVFQVVKALRLNHPDCVTSEEHYKFCYRIASDVLDSFDTYANFKNL